MFDSPFRKWCACHDEIMRAGRAQGQEDLTSSFASALMERAMLDGVSRLHGEPIFRMIEDGAVECASLQCPGFGVFDEPDWPSMTPMARWVK